MSALYLKRFRKFMSRLQKLELQNVPTRADILVSDDMLVSDQWQTTANFMGQLQEFGLGGTTIKMKGKGSVFALSGRNTVLDEFEKDSIDPRSAQNNVKYYHDQLFRSYQMLLMNTATSEFHFVSYFFDIRGDPMLFHEVFDQTKQFSLDSLEAFVAECWDAVGLLLMIRIVELSRECMQKREVSCLDSYFDALQQQLWPQLELVLKENTASLHRAAQQGLAVPGNKSHVHLVTRRYAELAASLHALSAGESSLAEIEKPLQSMQMEARNLLETMASKIEGPDAFVFLVNNYDLVLTIFPKAGFEELWGEQVQKFVESQLKRHFPDLVSFVTVTEPLVQGLDDNSTRAAGPYQGPPSGVDVPRMDEVVRSFARSWKQKIDHIHTDVMTSVQRDGMDIVNQVIKKMQTYYERLRWIIDKCFPQQKVPFQNEVIPKNTMLKEVQRYK